MELKYDKILILEGAMTKKQEYTQEFKENAVKLVLSQDRSSASIARELGIPEWKLRSWVSNYRKTQLKNKGNNSKTAVSKLTQLEKENKLLKLENEILKKAAAFFAKCLP